MITLVSLGRTKGELSLDGYETLRNAKSVAVRDSDLRDYSWLGEFCCDAIADEAFFERLAARKGDVVCAMAGNALTYEITEKFGRDRSEIRIVPAAVPAAPARSYTVVCADDLGKLYDLNTDLTVTVRSDGTPARAIAKELRRFYGAETVAFANEDPTTLDSFGKNETKFFGTLVVSPSPILEKERFGFGDLMRIMDLLTAPDGCPWDRAQTHASIRGNLVEEAYETVDAIDRGDRDNLIEELGDLLLQSVFHCVIASNAGEFDQGDVLDTLCTKLIFRHPHVFGPKRAKDSEGALNSWEQAKAVEKRQETLADKLDGIPASFPQTLRAVKVAKRAASSGIGADLDTAVLFDMVRERLERFGEGDAERTLGECLYALCSAARLEKIDPEIALKKVIDGYVLRFRRIEENLARKGIRLADASRAEAERATAEVLRDELLRS